MHMNKNTCCWQVLSSFSLMAVCVQSGLTAYLEDTKSGGFEVKIDQRLDNGRIRLEGGNTKSNNVMQRRWGQQVFRRYNPDDFASKRKKWKRGFDQTELKKPEKLTTIPRRPRPQAPSKGVNQRPIRVNQRPSTVNQRPIMWIPLHMPRLSTYRDRLAMKQVLLEVGVGAKIKV